MVAFQAVDPGSTPGRRTLFWGAYSSRLSTLHLTGMARSLISKGVGGVTVSMVAFQAVDPGSTPGRRTFFVCFLFFKKTKKETNKE